MAWLEQPLHKAVLKAVCVLDFVFHAVVQLSIASLLLYYPT